MEAARLALDGGSVAGIAVEAAFALLGLWLLWRHALSPAARAARPPARLGPWPGAASDLFLLLLLTLGGAFGFAIAASFVLRWAKADLNATEVWLIAASQGGLLAGAGAFYAFFASWRPRAAAVPSEMLRSGLVTFFLIFPIVVAVAFLWQNFLQVCGVPVRQQDAVEIFERTHSLFLRCVFAGAAMIIAPITEEIIFRAGIFRFLRSHVPRPIAIGASALLFGAAHLYPSPLDGLAAFVPLVVLGVVLSLAYERTGRISTTMVAHALFNLNTLVALLLGLNL